MFGTLPPIDAIFGYILEQVYVFILGGSATSTNMRLIVNVVISFIVSLSYFIPNDIAIVCILSAFGYLLSAVDIFHIIDSLRERKKNRTVGFDDKLSDDHVISVKSITLHEVSQQKNSPKTPIPRLAKLILYHFFMLCATCACSMIIYNIFQLYSISSETCFQVQSILLYICMGVFVMCKVFGDVQSAYIFFGLIRNPFYPTNVLSKIGKESVTVNNDRLAFKIIKVYRLVLIKFGKFLSII